MYECPNCGGNLKFEIESQLLKVCCLWFNENKSKGQEAPFPRSGQAAWKEKWTHSALPLWFHYPSQRPEASC